MSNALTHILTVIIVLGVTFMMIAIPTFIISWAFGYEFSWKIAIGVYFLVMLIRATLHGGVKQ